MMPFPALFAHNQTCNMKHWFPALCFVSLSLFTNSGCRQKMAAQPSYRPYQESAFFEDKRSSRPLERGVIHRGQYIDSDPFVTGLTREEWGRIYAREAGVKIDLATPTPIENRAIALGLPRYDQRLNIADEKVYVEEFPFPITADDLSRGQERFTIFCAVCHGSLGNGQGKIWERGYLIPTSFHTEMVGTKEVAVNNAPASPLGYSRGYALWDIKIPMREVPVGYIFEVITKGYGGMPNYAAQIAPDDRWRIVAYVRALQYSQRAPANTLPPDVAEKVNAAGGNP